MWKPRTSALVSLADSALLDITSRIAKHLIRMEPIDMVLLDPDSD
jgi:hypothetical protein